MSSMSSSPSPPPTVVVVLLLLLLLRSSTRTNSVQTLLRVAPQTRPSRTLWSSRCRQSGVVTVMNQCRRRRPRCSVGGHRASLCCTVDAGDGDAGCPWARYCRRQHIPMYRRTWIRARRLCTRKTMQTDSSWAVPAGKFNWNTI